jgi:hypothetical protein
VVVLTALYPAVTGPAGFSRETQLPPPVARTALRCLAAVAQHKITKFAHRFLKFLISSTIADMNWFCGFLRCRVNFPTPPR